MSRRHSVYMEPDILRESVSDQLLVNELVFSQIDGQGWVMYLTNKIIHHFIATISIIYLE